MREILFRFFDTYTLFFSRGRLVPLFFVALIILFFCNKKNAGHYPLSFVLSPWTAVSCALVASVGSILDKMEGKKKMLSVSAASLLCVLMIASSGASVWSKEFVAPNRELQKNEQVLENVRDRILAADPRAKVAASEDVLLTLLSVSPGMTPLYVPPAPGKEDTLSEADHILCDAFSSQHPDFEQIYRLCHKEERFFAVIDRDRMWPEHGFEHGFDLLDSVDHFDIYVYTGGAYE